MVGKPLNKRAIQAALVYIQANERGGKVSYYQVQKMFGIDRRNIKYYVDKIQEGKIDPDLELSAEEMKEVEEKVKELLGENPYAKTDEEDEELNVVIDEPSKLAEIEREKIRRGEELDPSKNIKEVEERERDIDIPLDESQLKINPIELMKDTRQPNAPAGLTPTIQTSDIARRVYENLINIDPSIIIRIAGIATLRGYMDINHFINYELIPWYMVKLQLETEAGVRINPVRFIEAFKQLVFRNKILDEIIKKIETAKDIKLEVKERGG